MDIKDLILSDAGIYDDYKYYLKQSLEEIATIYNVDINSVTLEREDLDKVTCIMHGLSYSYIIKLCGKYLTSIPRMTKQCYFIIDGQERVIPSREKKRVSVPIYSKDVEVNKIIYSSLCKIRFNGAYRTACIGICCRVLYLVITKTNKEEYLEGYYKGYPLVHVIKYLNINIEDVIKATKYNREAQILLTGFCDVDITDVVNMRFDMLNTTSLQISYIIDNLLDLHYGITKPTDLDHYSYKEILTPGKLYKRHMMKVIRDGKPEKTLLTLYKFILRGTALTSGKTLKGFSAEYGRRSYIDGISSIRKIILQCDINSSDETIRSVHPSQYMFVCPSDTPESKEIGIVKSYALSVRVSRDVDYQDIIYLFKDYIINKPIIKVIINNLLYFYIKEINVKMVNNIINIYNKQHKYLTIYNHDNNLFIRCDSGRLVRPVMCRNKILYVDPGYPIDDRMKNIHDCFVSGYVASHIPFINFNPGSRSVFGCSIIKQALCYNYDYDCYDNNFRTLYNNKSLVYGQRSICGTITSSMMEEEVCNTTNVIIAVSTYGCYNQEDSIVVNKSSIQRGLFNSITRVIVKIIVPLRVIIKFMVKEHDKVRLGDTIAVYIGVTSGIALTEVVTFNPKCNRTFVVNDIKQSVTHTSRSYFVGCESYKYPEVGDKLSSKHAQKGVISEIVDQHDMPYSMTTGITPDIIINPHAIPSRMTMGHILEMLIGKNTSYYTKSGFDGVNIEDIKGNLIKIGLDPSGKEPMICGSTGELLETRVYMGICSYFTMKQFSEDKIRARDTGKRSTFSYQPQSGSKGSGLRIGEMEDDCLISHGCLDALYNVVENSDVIQSWICQACGCMLDINVCDTCKREGRSVRIPYSLKMFRFILESMNISMRFMIVDNY